MVATIIGMRAPVSKGYKSFPDVIWLEEVRRKVFSLRRSQQQGGGLGRAGVEARR